MKPQQKKGSELTQEEKNFDFTDMKSGMKLLKCGKNGADGERFFSISGDLRYISWQSKLFSKNFGRINDGNILIYLFIINILIN